MKRILSLDILFSIILIASLLYAKENNLQQYSPYGVMVHFERQEFYPPKDIHLACKLIKSAGIQWISTFFNWKDIEPAKGKFDFTRTDEIISIASFYNLDILAVLWLPPAWARSSPSNPEELEKGLYPPKYASQFANYAYRVVKRYKDKIKYWQIWGEPNISDNWLPESNPEEYFKILKASYRKIKKADRNAQVVLGSLALKNIEDFLDKLYQLGAKDYFDVLAINPYVHPTLKHDPYLKKEGDPIELVKIWIFKVRQIMSKYGDSLKPLWITEIGSPGQDEPGNWWLLETTPTEQEQAEWLKRLYTEILKEDLADKIFWYNFRTPPDESFARAGLLDLDFRIKPAYFAYKDLQKLKNRQGLNILLISVDCLRPDHLSCYGYRRPTSPTLEKLANQGVKFTQTISVAPWTSPSLISLLTSFYPPTHGIDGRTKSLQEGIQTPIKILKKSGYLVPGISYIHTVWNYYNLGFDVIKEPTKFEQKDEEIQINQWLEKNYQKKFFFWHHFYAPHLPYNPLAEYEELFIKQKQKLPEDLKYKLKLVRTQPAIRKGKIDFKKRDLAYIIPLYDAEIRQADSQIKAIINKLDELGILYKTIVIITADHGEEFLEHGAIGHASTTLAASLYDECIRIPLIFWNPRVLPQGKIINQQVQNIDIMPTIFELLNLDMNIPAQGKSLLDLIQNKTSEPPHKFAFSDTTLGGFQSTQEQEKSRIRSIRTDHWKLIHNYAPNNETYSLFNLKKDPNEKKNVVNKYPKITQNLISQLQKWTFVCLTDRAWFKAKTKSPEAKKVLGNLDKIQAPKILLPQNGSSLIHKKANGEVILKWKGEPNLWYIVEYDIGKNDLKMTGSFLVNGNQQTFGPIPKDVWNLLPAYNPWRIRVKVKDNESLQSNWVNFNFSSEE